MIANYGIEKWFRLQSYEGNEGTYAELKLLERSTSTKWKFM